ncbi:MAG: 50S ribosomal protein L5 [bacterium]
MKISLKEKYQKEVIPEMRKEFGYPSVMAVPRIEKVVVNTGFGKLISGKSGEESKKVYNGIIDDLATIVGQRPVVTRAKKSIASFKLREGMPVGACVTLRRMKMYDFLDRMIHISLPRARDFRGIDQKAFDKKGNLTISVRENIIFPEISPERARSIFGFEITIVTTAESREEGIALLKLMGFPLKKIEDEQK